MVQAIDLAISRASEGGYPFAVVAVAPALLPGERRPEMVYSMAERLPEFIRSVDIIGTMDGDALIVGSENDHVSAAVLADRLQSELRLRTMHMNGIGWDSGFACLPDDGGTAAELIARAMAETKTRRRRLAAQ